MKNVHKTMLDALEIGEVLTSDRFPMENMDLAAMVAKWVDGTAAAFDFETTDVHILPNTIRIASYAFVQDQPVQLTTTGTLPAGILPATTYFIDVVDANYLRLLDAPGGSIIVFTDDGSGTHTIEPVAYAPTFETSDVDPTVDTITVTAHAYPDELPVQLTTTDTLPAPLALATDYFVIVEDADTIQLEATVGGGAINITDKGAGTHTITPNAYAPTVVAADIDYDADIITIIGHAFVDELPLQLTTTGTLPGGLALATDYFVIVVDVDTIQLEATVGGGAIDITDKGTGTHTMTPNAHAPTFDPPDVNAEDNTVYIAAHLMTLDLPVQLTTSGTLPAGLALATTYFVINPTTDSFQLSLTEGGVAVDITDKGTGTHTVTPLAYAPTFTDTNVDDVEDSIGITNHTFAADEHVEFTTSGTLPAGLSLATPYFVLIVDDDTIQVSLSSMGAAVDITDGGTGTHTITRSTAADDMEQVSVSESLITLTAHEFVENEHVEFTTAGTLPAGLSLATAYFVLIIDVNTIQVSLSPAGGAVDITDHGSGTHTVTRSTAADDMELISIVAHNIVMSSHEFVEDEQVQLTTTDTLPGGLSLATTYFVIVTDANNIQLEASLGGGAVDLTSRGIGTHTVTRTEPAQDMERVSALGNEITIIAHLFVEDEVTQMTTTDTLPAGLSLATDYYILNADADAFQVALTPAGAAVDITDKGTGTHTITRTTAADDIEQIAPDGDEMFEAAGHGLVDEQIVRVSTDTTLPAPLLAATDYFVIVLDEDSYQLATTRANAILGTQIDITTVGVGTHTLTPTGIGGTIQFQGSVKTDPEAADWVDLASGTIAVPGAGSPLPLDFANLAYQWLRAVWTPTGGSGDISVDVNAKGIG